MKKLIIFLILSIVILSYSAFATPPSAPPNSVTGVASTDIDTLAELNTIVADATLLDDGAIADSNAIGLATGATHATFGAAGDDTIDEMFTAIDTAIGGKLGTSGAAGSLTGYSTGAQPLATVLTSLASLTETNGGIAYGTGDNAYAWLAAGAQGTLLMGNGAGAPSFLGAGTSGYMLVAAGAADPVWTLNTGTGAPMRGTAPTITTSLSFNAVTDTVGGIQNQNIIDKSADEIWASDKYLAFGATGLGRFEWITADSATGKAATLALRNASDVPIFWFDLANSSLGVAAVAGPSINMYDLNAVTGETNLTSVRPEQYAAGMDSNMTIVLDHDWIADVSISTMMDDDATPGGTDDNDSAKVKIFEWTGLAETMTLGDSATGEDLVLDFEAATDNEVTVGTNSGVVSINFPGIGIKAPMEVTAAEALKTVATADLNTVRISSAAGDWDLPADSCDSATGNWLTVIANAGHIVSITSLDTSDQFVLTDGTVLTADDELDTAGSAWDSCTVLCVATNLWVVVGERGTCADGGAAD